MKKIITCPDCQLNGVKQNLAEILDDGTISILRIHKGFGIKGKNFTLVGGDNLYIKCGTCGEVVYRKGS